MMLSLALATNVVFAGNKNMNGDHGIQGTGKINDKSGCRAMGGDIAVDLGPPLGAVWGGACCASNEYLYTTTGEGNDVYAPVQCCNPPDHLPFPPFTDTEEHHPGNHCLCFEIRGYEAVL